MRWLYATTEAIQLHILGIGGIILFSYALLAGEKVWPVRDYYIALALFTAGYPVGLFLVWSRVVTTRRKPERERRYPTPALQALRDRRTARAMSLAFLWAAALFLGYFGVRGLRIENMPAHYLGLALGLFAAAGQLGFNIWYGGPFDMRADPGGHQSQSGMAERPRGRACSEVPMNIVERINRNGSISDPDVPSPLLTLEEFFGGNDDPGSIGCNLPDIPGPDAFFEALTRLRARPEVADVRVEVTMWDDPDSWPFSDAVWIITSLEPSEIQDFLGEQLRGDDVRVGWPEHAVEPVNVPPGMKPICVWWD